MAVTKFTFLDEQGVQDLSTILFKATNTRIKERILTAIDNSTMTTWSDNDHTLSAAAILGMIGNINYYDIAQGETNAIDPTASTVLAKIKALQLAVGTSADTSADDTVYGEIATVRSEISALNHLTYQVVTGDIATEVPAAQAKTDVIYLQHDEPSMMIARDGYLMHDANTRATANDGENDYNAWYDASDGKIYKMVSGVKGAELASSDAIFDNVAMVADSTYNLYIAQPTSYAKNNDDFLLKYDGTGPATFVSGDDTYYAYDDNGTWKLSTSSSSYTPTSPETVIDETHLIFRGARIATLNWLCVGDTSLDLANYWDKSDASVNELKNLILDNISNSDIVDAVHNAFDATDPYDGSSSYVDSWLS